MYKSRCIFLSRQVTTYTHASVELPAVGRVRIWHVRIVLCLTIMQRRRLSVCHLTAKDCVNNVAANIRFCPLS